MHGELKQVADLALFAKIVQTGGISRCAADLGMERTTISRRLSTLERSLGVKLLHRTPKRMVVTDAGRRCRRKCAAHRLRPRYIGFPHNGHPNMEGGAGEKAELPAAVAAGMDAFSANKG